jgi:hypothetical protein
MWPGNCEIASIKNIISSFLFPRRPRASDQPWKTQSFCATFCNTMALVGQERKLPAEVLAKCREALVEKVLLIFFVSNFYINHCFLLAAGMDETLVLR